MLVSAMLVPGTPSEVLLNETVLRSGFQVGWWPTAFPLLLWSAQVLCLAVVPCQLAGDELLNSRRKSPIAGLILNP